MNRAPTFRRTVVRPLCLVVFAAAIVVSCTPPPPQPTSSSESTATTPPPPSSALVEDEAVDTSTESLVEPEPSDTRDPVAADDTEVRTDPPAIVRDSSEAESDPIAGGDAAEEPAVSEATDPVDEQADGSEIATPADLAPSAASPERGVQQPALPRAARQAGAPVVLAVGHVDIIEVIVEGGQLRISVKDDTQPSGAVFRSPADVQIRVPDGARIPVPYGPFGFLGPEGSSIHLLPQVQDPELIWPGWSTQRMSAGQVVGDLIRMRLTGVDGPGQLTLFTTDQFGTPTVLFNSSGGTNQLDVPIRTHAHSNWSFSAPGIYRVSFEVAATLSGGATVATTATYAFLVGDDAQPLPPGAVPPPQPGTPAPGALGGGPTPAGAGVDGGDPATQGSVDQAAGAVGSSGAGSNPSASRAGAAGSLAQTGSEPSALITGATTMLLLGLVAMGASAVLRRSRRTT